MKINALTVCVNYAETLRVSLPRWMPGLASLTIVTDPEDADTAALAEQYGARVHVTNVFYERGATFNKGAAMEEARKRTMEWADWGLFFDADIIPEDGWSLKLDEAEYPKTNLYSAWRHQCDDITQLDRDWPRITHDGLGVGYFQLFHTADRAVRDEPVVETMWKHAGNYDNGFMRRWPVGNRKLLPIRLLHVGPRDNWWGKGNTAAFAAMQEERAARGGWQHEHVAELTELEQQYFARYGHKPANPQKLPRAAAGGRRIVSNTAMRVDRAVQAQAPMDQSQRKRRVVGRSANTQQPVNNSKMIAARRRRRRS